MQTKGRGIARCLDKSGDRATDINWAMTSESFQVDEASWPMAGANISLSITCLWSPGQTDSRCYLDFEAGKVADTS